MKPAITVRTKPLQGSELLGALERLQGLQASRMLRMCGYVTRNGKGQRRRRPRAFVQAVVQARGTQPSIENHSVQTVVRWACVSDQPKSQKPVVSPPGRSPVLALARQGIEEYREALLELAR